MPASKVNHQAALCSRVGIERDVVAPFCSRSVHRLTGCLPPCGLVLALVGRSARWFASPIAYSRRRAGRAHSAGDVDVCRATTPASNPLSANRRVGFVRRGACRWPAPPGGLRNSVHLVFRPAHSHWRRPARTAPNEGLHPAAAGLSGGQAGDLSPNPVRRPFRSRHHRRRRRSTGRKTRTAVSRPAVRPGRAWRYRAGADHDDVVGVGHFGFLSSDNLKVVDRGDSSAHGGVGVDVGAVRELAAFVAIVEEGGSRRPHAACISAQPALSQTVEQPRT